MSTRLLSKWVRDSSVVASHKLVIENSVVDKKRAIYFYTLDSVGETTRPQANVAEGYDAQASWTARVDKQWLEKLHASFVSEWLNSVGAQITRPKNKTFGFEFSPKGLVIKHWGERGNYSKSTSLIEVDGIGRSSKQTNINVQSKDVLPVLNGLVGLDIEGKITLSVSGDVLSLVYQTELASYRVVIPTCNKHGRRNATAFEAYEG